MSFDEHPAAENVRYLRHGIGLIRELDDRLWSAPGSPPGQGVGAQFRHCIDFYACFLRGLSEAVLSSQPCLTLPGGATGALPAGRTTNDSATATPGSKRVRLA